MGNLTNIRPAFSISGTLLKLKSPYSFLSTIFHFFNCSVCVKGKDFDLIRNVAKLKTAVKHLFNLV